MVWGREGMQQKPRPRIDCLGWLTVAGMAILVLIYPS